MLLTFTIDIGLALKNIRLKKNLTQEKVAEMANIDEKHYGRIERNICYPKIDTLLSIFLALQINPTDFFKENLTCITKQN